MSDRPGTRIGDVRLVSPLTRLDGPATAAGEIADESAETTRAAIERFAGRHAFLSNFYPCTLRVSPADLLIDPEDRSVETYPSAEHAFQASKALSLAVRDVIRDARTPAQAKRLGRRVALRPDWERLKTPVMLAVLRAKFSDPGLAASLLSTGDRRLVEGNTWGDVEWGVFEGRGQNRLGRILETVREEIRVARKETRP